MKRLILIVSVLAAMAVTQKSFAQYPTIPDDVKKASEKLMNDARAHSDMMWEKAIPFIEEDAANGKPYIPWAKRPYDLPQAEIPAFPGAEGGGMYTYGGRGGKVLTVTSLEDDGPGTLREACEQGGARTIVFNVAGIIKLKSPLIIRAPYLTIAGQTAPGKGICIAGETVWINTHDVIIRHMRFRRGETWVGRRDDAIGGNPVGNIMLDHISASWGLDENMSIYRHMYLTDPRKLEEKMGTVNITIQNSIFSEGLDTWNHAFGSTIGGENCSFMRNLWANNTGRNPSIGWNGVFNFANNVMFNWVHRSVDGGDQTARYNLINNYYKPGPLTPTDQPVGHRMLKPESRFTMNGRKVYGLVYVNGNVVEGNEAVSKDNWNGGVQIENMEDAGEFTKYIRVNRPHPMPYMTIYSAEEAFDFVLKNAGAIFPKRDEVDQRISRTVKTGIPEYVENVDNSDVPKFKHRRLPEDSYKNGIITDIRQVGGYPEYNGKPYVDTDKDGMPDEWEIKYKKVGFDPNDPSDANKDFSGDGYTNIEKYINGIDPTKKVDWKNLENNFDTLTKNGGVL
ncbi:pectate lyase [Prolixibacteraceae bacterium Z1-6]|uniref:Pectate lyase n=1 Tax=Draconibacterium aestuarii TaxID=2998507 RepID=A0A9X3F7J2_9BACT|nr:pectate lyase [Prolixibacteraceae bacterium Z1-6]